MGLRTAALATRVAQDFSVWATPAVSSSSVNGVQVSRPVSFNFRPWFAASLLLMTSIGCGSSSASDGSGAAGETAGGESGSASGGSGQAGLAGASTQGGSAHGGAGDGGSSGATAGSAGAGGGQAGTSPVGNYAIASTSRGNCALDSTGTIHCWGYLPNVWSIPSGAFVELHASIDAVCAIRADHSVVCFDPPDGTISGVAGHVPKAKVQTLALQRGTLCSIDETGPASCNSIYSELTVPSGEAFLQLSVGIQFACGIRVQDGSISCWGSPGSAACAGYVPAAGQLVAPSGYFASISSGIYSSCALSVIGEVTCWGAGKPSDDPAALCMGSTFNLGQASPPPGTFRSVAVSANHTCGVKTDGTVACWGAGTADVGCPELDQADCRQSRPPAGVFAQVSVGSLHSCAMTLERKVQCWGYPGSGATGDGRIAPPAEFQ